MSGGWVDARGGVALGDGIGPTWAATAGPWRGRYDDGFAIGRAWGVGVGAGSAAGATYAFLEARRSVDLLLVGGRGAAHVGVASTGAPYLGAGAAARLRVRPTGRFVAWEIGVQGGTTVERAPESHLGLTAGLSLTAPWRTAP